MSKVLIPSMPAMGVPQLCSMHYRGSNPVHGTVSVFILFYIHGSVYRESNLITVQQDAIYSVYYISVGSSTCFGC